MTHERNESNDEGYGVDLFSSTVNMGGGGGPIIQTEKQERSLRARARANVNLCGAGMIAGAGMFSESYFLFAIGNISIMWEQIYPQCYNATETSCNDNLVSSFTYVEVLGVILGMLSFGFLADKLGRRWGSCTTALTMFIGGVLTTAAYAGPGNLNGMFIFFAVALFIFGYGVGGEYPLASASAAEKAEALKQEHGHTGHHVRGKSVVMVFAMQGWGSWFNTALILIILIASGCSATDCSDNSMELTWRLQYGIGAFFLLVLVLGRFVFLKESKVWLERKQRQEAKVADLHDGEARISSRRMVFKYYWHRLVGTSVGWYVWDVVFYGNKLFQTTIISQIVPTGTSQVVPVLEYTLLNATVALVGYYAAALAIDKPWMGRRRLQTIGFFMTFVLFLICAVAYDTLTQEENIHWFQMVYYLSTFFGQFGPNATTWLLPSELFPTEVRTVAHGMSAASGKLGALTATLLFTFGNSGSKMDPQSIFYVCAFCGLIGLLVTELFVPDVTTLDLASLDEQWEFIAEGKGERYDGPASRPEFLSLYERCSQLNRFEEDTDSDCSGQNAMTIV